MSDETILADIKKTIADNTIVLFAKGTKEQIHRVAKKLGYKPNPRLGKLMSEIAHSRKASDMIGELAFLTSFNTEFEWRQSYHLNGCFEGAKRQARPREQRQRRQGEAEQAHEVAADACGIREVGQGERQGEGAEEEAPRSRAGPGASPS